MGTSVRGQSHRSPNCHESSDCISNTVSNAGLCRLLLGARNPLRGACVMNITRAEQQMRERINLWLQGEIAAMRPMRTVNNLEELLYRFELYLGDCEERRQRA